MSQGLNVHYTGRACCIFVPSLRNEPVVARGKSSTTESQNRKENDAWWLQLPHQRISHIMIWWLEGHSWLADSRANLPSCSSSVFPSCLTIKRPELRVSPLPGTGRLVCTWCLCWRRNTGSREFWFLKHSSLFSWMGISILFHISLWIENFISLKKDLRNRTVFDVNKLYEHKT